MGLDIDIREDRLTGNEKLEADDTFKDYESVQVIYAIIVVRVQAGRPSQKIQAA